MLFFNLTKECSIIKTHPFKDKMTISTLKDLIIESLDDNKAEDIVVIDLAGKSDMADYMIIASGRSDRHVGALSNHISEAIKKSGISTMINVEGTNDCNWVLVDTMDVIVHLFKPEVRAFYNLEKMWALDIPASVTATDEVFA